MTLIDAVGPVPSLVNRARAWCPELAPLTITPSVDGLEVSGLPHVVNRVGAFHHQPVYFGPPANKVCPAARRIGHQGL